MEREGGRVLLPAARSGDLELATTSDAQPLAPVAIDGSSGAQADATSRRRRIFACFALGAALLGLAATAAALASGSRSGSSGASTAAAQGRRLDVEQANGSSSLVTFFALGDWGRQGQANQAQTAALMGQVAGMRPPDFIISTGDNFYPHGLSSVNDPLFNQSFMSVYTAPGLQVPWHAVLGNHDYTDSAPVDDTTSSPLYQLNISLASRDPRWHCERAYSRQFGNGSVEVFFIDTSPFILAYQTTTWSHSPGGLAQQSWQAQLLELEWRLNSSQAAWKLAVGHHPTYSSGEHGNNQELIEHLEPLFQRYNVQAYFAGHDHNLEHLALANYSAIVTGAGSDTRPIATADPNSRYFYGQNGFVAVEVQAQQMTVDFYTLSAANTPAYTATIPLKPTPST